MPRTTTTGTNPNALRDTLTTETISSSGQTENVDAVPATALVSARLDRHTPAVERFLSRVDRSGECWMFVGGKKSGSRGQYATFMVNARRVYVHRFAYELWHGPIPEDMTVDHICGIQRCVRPDHLQLLTGSQNSSRWFREQRQVCRNGLHPISESVQTERRGKTALICAPCRDAALSRHAARQREKYRARKRRPSE